MTRHLAIGWVLFAMIIAAIVLNVTGYLYLSRDGDPDALTAVAVDPQGVRIYSPYDAYRGSYLGSTGAFGRFVAESLNCQGGNRINF